MPVVPVWKLITAPVALPVDKPGRIVKAAPATLVPTAFSPFNVAVTGLALASELPNVTVLFFNIKLLILTIVPALVSFVAVAAVVTLMLNVVEVAPAEVTGHVPSKLVIVELAIVT